VNNPLTTSLLTLLEDNPAGLSEHQILKSLAEHPALQVLEDNGNLSLFRKHFLVMNGLYQLQEELAEKETHSLIISPITVQRVKRQESAKAELEDSASSSLRDYYLNWKNYDKTGEADVEKLLSGFWKQFYRAEGRSAALQVLDLPDTATPLEIKQCYRKLAAENHPDKGGDQERFIEIREAYEMLVG